MAMANVAECFREKDVRVLMIDWDLEAPGLETFFYIPGSPELTQARTHIGLIELLQKYKTEFSTMVRRSAVEQVVPLLEVEPEVESSRLPAFLKSTKSVSGSMAVTMPTDSLSEALDRLFPDLNDYLVALPTTGKGALLLMPAGDRGEQGFAGYARSIQEFDWTEFYALYEGKEFFEWFGRKLDQFVDVVLIDSRTGVTEMGGVCTRQLADVVVSLCTPSTQNVDGTIRIVRSLDKSSISAIRGDRELQVVMVPCRIDNTAS